MVWPFLSPPEKSETEESAKAVATKPEPKEARLLSDRPKRFDPDKYNLTPEKKTPSQLEFNAAVGQISLKDFTFANLVKIPCFREAGLIGFSALGVMTTTMFLVHKNPSRAANWGVGAGLLGSLVGWEQCRSQRARSFQNVELAKKVFNEKHRKKKDGNE